VDLSLRDLTSGAYCDLGGRFEQINDIAVTDYFERQLAAGAIAAGDTRLTYRRLLHWAMRSEGFENDPSTFWHYDWGNHLYMKTARALRAEPAKAAWYGYIAPP
jgi:D-alanyl-D-alanine dipeptidase